METYEWIIPLCILIAMLGLVFLTLRHTTKAKWQITLKDGKSFIGRKTWIAIWREGFLERAYRVVDSQESSFKEGVIIVFGFGTILYRIKQ